MTVNSYTFRVITVDRVNYREKYSSPEKYLVG